MRGASSGQRVLVTGATGYLGSRLVRALVARGHDVRALVRQGSQTRVPLGAHVFVGDALSASDYGAALDGVSTVVHLVGVAHPSPAKAAVEAPCQAGVAVRGVSEIRASSVSTPALTAAQ